MVFKTKLPLLQIGHLVKPTSLQNFFFKKLLALAIFSQHRSRAYLQNEAIPKTRAQGGSIPKIKTIAKCGLVHWECPPPVDITHHNA